MACIAGVCVRTQRPCLHLCDDVPAGWAQLPTWAGLAAAAGQTRNTRIFTEAVSVNIVSPLQPGPRPARHGAGDRSEGGHFTCTQTLSQSVFWNRNGTQSSVEHSNHLTSERELSLPLTSCLFPLSYLIKYSHISEVIVPIHMSVSLKGIRLKRQF